MTVMQQTPPRTAAYQETVSGLLRLHRHTVEKQDTTDDYHDLCAALEGLWEQMTSEERERAGGLSQDLYTVSDPPPDRLGPMTPSGEDQLSRVNEARARGDWDEALTSLRQLDRVAPPALVARLRGFIWDGLGEAPVAAVFHERAHRLDSGSE